tara:strand:- start:88 stop:624 length:537 start_codon:yes stop_codon:yes gene_type:complete
LTKLIFEKTIPKRDKIFASFGIVNYEDCFCLKLKLKEKIDVDVIVEKLIISFPFWIKILLKLRNFLVIFFGLKTGNIENNYRFVEKLDLNQADYFGDIYILLKNEDHLIGELKDKHLDFRFSIEIIKEKDVTFVLLKTIVKYNNFFGRSYFFIVKPFHKIIVPNVLKRLSNELISAKI